MRGQYADRCVYYRLPELKEHTQAYWGGDHQTSSLKSENPNNQYTGYRLLGFHSSCRVLLPQSRVCQLKNPKSPVREVCPKTGCSSPLPVVKPAKRFKIGKSHPYPPLTALERPPRTQKRLKNLLDTLDFGEYCSIIRLSFSIFLLKHGVGGNTRLRRHYQKSGKERG